jgi:hypothetical protein
MARKQLGTAASDPEDAVTKADLDAATGGSRRVGVVNLFPFMKRTAFKTGQTTTATTLSASASATDTTITLTSVTGVSTDVLLILNPGTATQETAKVLSVAGSVVTLTEPLAFAHASGQVAGPFWTDPLHLTANGYLAAAYATARAEDENGDPVFDLDSGDHFTFLGNSWFNGSAQWEDQMEAAFAGSVGLNAGYSGNGSPEMIARFNNPPTDPLVSRGVDPASKYVIINEPGGNDFNDDLSTETFFRNMGTLIRLSWAIGATPVYLSAGPMSYDLPNTLQVEDMFLNLFRAGSVDPTDTLATLGSRDLSDWFPGAGATEMSDLSDVLFGTPAFGDFLLYNGTTWGNTPAVVYMVAILEAYGLIWDNNLSDLEDADEARDNLGIDATLVTGLVNAASETAAGKVELATVAEAEAGTDDARAVTPEGVAAAIAELGGGGVTSQFAGGQVARAGYGIGFDVSSASSTARVLNQYDMRPLRIAKGGVAQTKVSCYVGTAVATSKLRVGLHEHDFATGMPGALLFDWGQIDTSVLGKRTLTLPASWTPDDETIYWVGCAGQTAAPNVWSVNESDPLLPAMFAIAQLGLRCISQAGVSGALPSSPTPATGANLFPALIFEP